MTLFSCRANSHASHLTPRDSSSSSGNHPFKLRLDWWLDSNNGIIDTVDSKQIPRSCCFPLRSHIPMPYCHFSFSLQITTGRRLAHWMSCPVETAAIHIRKFQVEKVKLMWTLVSWCKTVPHMILLKFSCGAWLTQEPVLSSVACLHLLLRSKSSFWMFSSLSHQQNLIHFSH